MCYNSLLLCLSIISACFLVSTVEAIVDGFVIQGDPFPYQVSVQILGEGHVCGGGIIGEHYILTAAHCVLNRTRHLRSKHILVLSGTYNLNKTTLPAATISVEEIFFPSEFHPTVEFNHGDIAILKLKDSLLFEYRPHLRKLQLSFIDPADTISVIAGFGWNKIRKIGNKVVGSNDGHLRFIVPDILSNDQCEQSYPHGAIQSDIHLCTAAHPHYTHRFGVCHGDDGSPLVRGITILGVLSRIPEHCDERYESAVYTKVLHYLVMIINVMHRGRDPHLISLRL